MDSIAPRLPTVLGSFAALMVAFISFISETTPESTVMRATAAYVVFAAFGIVMRYLLGDMQGSFDDRTSISYSRSEDMLSEDIRPGTSVGDLLGTDEYHAMSEVGGPSAD